MTDAHVERFMAMGTRVELHAFGMDDRHILTLGRREVERVDDALTIHRPSPTVSLNEALARGGAAAVDDPVVLAALIESHAMMALTEGLFDPTLREGAPALAWSLDPVRGIVEADGPLAFDFGGIGKGIALDAAGAVLRAGGVQTGFLSAGESSILAIGHHPLGGPWPIGVPHPFAPGIFLAELELADEALSVSATVGTAAPARQPTLRAGDGTPVTAPLTVVAIAAQGAQAEALSTAVIVAATDQRERLMDCPSARLLTFFYDDRDAIDADETGVISRNA